MTIMQNKSALFRRAAARADVRALPGALSDRIRLTCLFGSFVFLQFTVLGLANHAGEGYLSTGQREMVYYALQVFVILGFLLHALVARLCDQNPKVSGARNGIAYAVFGLFFACAAVLLFAGADAQAEKSAEDRRQRQFPAVAGPDPAGPDRDRRSDRREIQETGISIRS